MIRIQKKTPEWVYRFASKVTPTNPVLECLVLEETSRVILNTLSFRSDEYSEIAMVPNRAEHSVKVLYEEWEEEFDKLVGIKPWHEKKMEMRERAAKMYDFGERDPRYHRFEYIDQYELYTFPTSENVSEYFLIFQDVYEGKWYITRSILLGCRYAPLAQRQRQGT